MAMLAGTMEGFFKLIEQYRTQDEPAFCGLARYRAVLFLLTCMTPFWKPQLSNSKDHDKQHLQPWHIRGLNLAMQRRTGV